MKKISFFIICLMLCLTTCFADGLFGPNTGPIATVQEKIEKNAYTAYPVPLTGNFLERKTLYDWTKRWDKPDIVCYTYFFIGSNCIGYFITHGKPASAQSYLLPEKYSYNYNRESPDVDGTYGTNNPGYRFFLADGTAVECSGAMVSCVYSDAPLSLSGQEIKVIKK